MALCIPYGWCSLHLWGFSRKFQVGWFTQELMESLSDLGYHCEYNEKTLEDFEQYSEMFRLKIQQDFLAA